MFVFNDEHTRNAWIWWLICVRCMFALLSPVYVLLIAVDGHYRYVVSLCCADLEGST